MKKRYSRPVTGMALSVFALWLVFVSPAWVSAQDQPQDQPPDQPQVQIDWIQGPDNPTLGNDLAEIDLGEEYLFTGVDGARTVMELTGNQPSNEEIGLIMSKDESEDWFILFEYKAVGYIKDDDKDEIDADEILDSYKQGTEEANKFRAEKGIPALHVVGWYEKPFYDDRTNNLVWAMEAASDDGTKSVNYNVRLLGRDGYVSAVLVAGPDTLDALKPKLHGLINGFKYKDGKRYADFVQGDKVAKIGLAALVAGGAGAAAVKFGLFKFLAKGWKIVAVAVIAFFGAIWGAIRKFFGRRGGGNDLTGE